MGKKFDLDLVGEKEAEVVMFGVRLGDNAKEMLDCLRRTSWDVEFFDVDREKNLAEGIKIADVGDLEISSEDDITKKINGILNQKKLPFMFSKSHLATYYALKAFPKDVKIISFDAHGDIKDRVKNILECRFLGKSMVPLRFEAARAEKYNSTTWLRRSLEDGVDDAAIIGLRSCDEFDFDFIKKNKVLYFTPKQIRENLEEVKQNIRKFVENSKVYLSIDIDVFDPAIAPAVDYPEADGILFPQFSEILKEVFDGKIVGIDLVEIRPMKENDVTEFLAVKIIYEVLGLLPRAGVT